MTGYEECGNNPQYAELVAVREAFWQRCVEAGCVIVPVRVFSQYGADGNTHAEHYVGIRFAAMPYDDDAVGPDYYFQIEEGQTGLEKLHETVEAALDWFEAKDRPIRQNDTLE